MTCSEFENYLPDLVDGSVNAADASHLQECTACAELVSDLKAICQGARALESDCEPNPRVWANIQRTLEKEGLIKPVLQPGAVLVQPSRRSLSTWLLPLTALLVLGVGTLVYNRRPVEVANSPSQMATQALAPATTQANAVPASEDADDEQLLAQITPSMRATYADNLRSVNAFIQDAQEDLKQNPDDDDARHFLMEAYEQKESLYDLALNRSAAQ